MEPLQLIAGFIVFFILLAWYIIWKGKRNAKDAKFDLMYHNFQCMLHDPLRPINKVSWDYLSKCFRDIEDLNWNAEKTDVLRGEFLKAYEPVTEEIEREFNEMMSENEYSPEMIFAGE